MPKPSRPQLSREAGSITPNQVAAVEAMIPRYESAHRKAGLESNLSSDWRDGSAFDGQQLLWGMRSVTRDLESRQSS